MNCQCKYYLRDNNGQLRCVQCGKPPHSKEVLLPSKGGRPRKEIPLERIKEMSKEGMGVKNIAKQLQRDGDDISAMTVVRALRSNSTLGEGD